MEIHAIYKIWNIINNKCYIGSAIDINSRFYTHKWHLKKDTQPNKHLRAAYNKYGKEAFKFLILETVADKENLLKREQIWINYFESYDPNLGYNKRRFPNSNLGIKRKHSEETKLKIGLANSKSLLGNKDSEWTKIKKSVAMTGLKRSEQAKENMRIAWIKRKDNIGGRGYSASK